MVDMALQSQYLLNIILLFLLVLSNLIRCSSDFFLSVLHLTKEISVLSTNCLNSIFEPLNLKGWVFVIGENVFFFDLKGSGCLLGAPLFVNKFSILSL